ncbi:hypothetical protein Pcinc_021685 [Petrolisthes cinctipes]|uniref:Uncharacterized protein n=1 Tax=Petrolisthes cinctipes TaxID=88211 RepID=A0AAE1FF43_PETCI|nr:hypothetical protein Pcinc_021685 [Petrolisthes cinctipes]
MRETEGGAREVSSSGGWLNLTRVKAEDRGWYKCATTHSFGHFASHSVFINVLGEGGGGAGIHTPQLLRKTASTSSSTQAALHPSCPFHPSSAGTQDLPGWVAVVALNSTVETVGGGIAVLAARVCGHPLPSSSALTWLPPYHLPPIRPGHSRDRLRAHNLTQIGPGGCRRAALSVSGVRGSDAGAWVLVAAGRHHADATLIRLNVTAAAHAVAASAAHTFLPALLPALLPFCCLAPRP